jgi:cytochrome c oxidase cbb3-type subunit 1
MEAQGRYNYKVVRQFAVMSVVWGVVGMLVGVVIAAQLMWPEVNFGIPWLSYGRLRPLHTNAVIFAFGGCALMATSYYVVQRTSQVRIFSDALAAFTFWGWQLVIVLAAITLPLGYTSGKEYAELEWPIDLLIAAVWVSYAIVFFGTLAKRKVKHIYVANWFFGAFILTVALLHIVESTAVPVSFWKSYSAYAGVQDAMVQWWYGHNAVGFFLTAGFLGMMYYFIPKQAGRPIYSYRLSIVHFWSLIFTYMWAGPHHLHYTALPDWTQSLGMIFSLILLAPSWGGMINGIMTLSGAWHKLRTDPILKFLVVSLSFYGMVTFEGPMMSIKTVNALSHWTGFTFVGYFTPIRDLTHSAATLSFGGWEAFWILFYGFATYGNAGWMREQVCKHMCPYARFQSVMFDADTLVIEYDVARGEPRGGRGRNTDARAAGLGDCVDCNICVQVCPTGIDIRRGLQYECIGCAACIDGCNQVMHKMHYAPGLIRYSTENAMKNAWSAKQILRRVARARVLAYTSILGAVVVAASISLWMRAPMKVDVIRDRGSLSREVEGGKIENVFRLQIMNTEERPRQVRIEARSGEALRNLEVLLDVVSMRVVHRS